MWLLDPSGPVSSRDVFGLLVSEGQEWPHKVGVAGRLDGSGKASTRLLASNGWVMKTDIARGSESREATESRLRAERNVGEAASVWHPSKRWAVFRAGDTFYPLTLCPELKTLRAVSQLEARLCAWLDMFALALGVARARGLGLDLNPANFGYAPGDERLYYLDDELYPEPSAQQFGCALAARIPEEPAVPGERWYGWGEDIGALLAQERRMGLSGAEVLAALADYPITEQFEPARAALHRGMQAGMRHKSGCSRLELVCVLADVHANLPALDAVLSRAQELGATRYLFLGDAVGYGPHPRECIARLAELPRAALIQGNHDHCIARGVIDRGMNGLARECAQWTLAELMPHDLAWLARLAVEHRDADWLAVHVAPRDTRRLFAYVYDLTFEDNLQWLAERELALCFHGHSHVQGAYVERAGRRSRFPHSATLDLSLFSRCLFNPGSVGQPRDGDPRAAFALFEPGARRIKLERVTYPIEHVFVDIERKGLPTEAGRRLLAGA